MADVIAAVDSITGAFGPLVQNRLRSDMQSAINSGVTATIAGMGDVVEAVAEVVAPLTTTTALKAVNALPSAAKNAITGWFHASGFGAVGDGATDDRAAIQAAMDAAAATFQGSGIRQRVHIDPKVHALNAVDYTTTGGSVFGATCLKLASGVEIAGFGTLKVKTGAYGPNAYFRILSSTSSGISNAAVRDLTFDGNTSNMPASTQCGNLSITVASNVEVTGTTHLNSNGVAIALGGASGTALAFNTKVLRNTVLSASDIGIQVSRFNGLDIGDNYVSGTLGNGIDIYGENGNGTSIGTNFTIHDNIVRSCGAVGIFPETVAQGTIHHNVIDSCVTAGIQVNRINGLPFAIDVSNNIVLYSPRGIAVVGDMQNIHLTDNQVRGASIACIQLGWGGAVSGVVCDGNILNGADGSVPRILVTGTQASALRTRGTISGYTDGATDVLDNATVSVNNVYESVNPISMIGRADAVASGGTLTFELPGTSAGRLLVYAESGGGWQSVWDGCWIASGSRVDLIQGQTGNEAPANLITSMTTTGNSRVVTVHFASTGSTIAARWAMQKV